MGRPRVGHRAELASALAYDSDAQRELLAGDVPAARVAFGHAASHYRASWELAPPGSYGRLVGMLKAAILAGPAHDDARFASEQLDSAPPGSPTAAYARALAALVLGDDDTASRLAETMRPGSDAFARAARALAALANRDAAAFGDALAEIVRDFEGRSEHLTGVAIADTALVLRELALRRGLAVSVPSPLLPELPAPGSSRAIVESEPPNAACGASSGPRRPAGGGA